MRIAPFVIVLILLAGIGGTGFRPAETISACYLTQKEVSGFLAARSDRLPAGTELSRSLPTSAGDMTISRIDGYRILYNNDHKVPFINLKAELSEAGSYGQDTLRILENLRYLNASSRHMESAELIQLRYNGYLITGFSRAAIDSGSTLGTFVMFPGNGVTLYFYFNNLEPAFRNFKTLDDYKAQRNDFLGEYTSQLRACRN